MILQTFIQDMEAGQGFHLPGRVMRMGSLLGRIFAGREEDLNKEVQVSYKRTSGGHGYSFHCSYLWTVKGVNLPLSMVEDMPGVFPTREGFGCGWGWY